jgi:hypothetical protein
MMTAFSDLAAEVAHYRKEYAKAKAQLDALYQAWLTETQQIGDTVSKMKDLLADAESRLRSAALNTYAATGEKKFPCGVGVKIATRMNYSPADALTWARAHNIALQLDKTAFEKIAKASPMEFVEFVEVPTATLPTDTAKLLEA